MTNTISGMSGGYQPQIVSGASMRRPPELRMANLFDMIDSNGSGNITKSQFEQAFQILNPPKRLQDVGADNIFAKLDPTNSGSVSKQDFITNMTALLAQLNGGQVHQHGSRSDGDADDGASGDDPVTDLTQALKKLEAALDNHNTSNPIPVIGTLFKGKA